MTESSSKQSVVQFLVSIVLKLVELFRTPEGEAYATFQVDDYHDTAPIRSNEFMHWLEDIYYEHANEVISLSDMRKLVRELLFWSRKMGARMSVYYRYAYVNGCIYVDLGNKKREQVEITPDGWHLIAAKNSPVKFIRKKGMAPLVKPERGGALNDMRKFFRLRSDADFVLMVCWVVGVMNPLGPFPILVFQGPHGSTKSTSCRLLQRIIDPSIAGLIGIPKGERGIAIAAFNSYLLAIDNTSGIHPKISDVFCRVVTGYSYRHRRLHTDNDEIIMGLKNPIVMNGITDIITRHDLADRAIVIQTKPIITDLERFDETEFEKRWDENLPYFLGCFYDALAMGLRNRNKISIPRLPRMADFAKFVVEAESALPFGPGAFLEAYRLNSERKIDAAIENDLVAVAVIKMMDGEPSNQWSGTAEELRLKLNLQTDEQIQKQQDWPKIANKLSNRLKRCEAPLRSKGIEIEWKHSGNRTISIRQGENNTAQTVQPVQTVPENYLPDGDKGPGNNNGASGASQLSYLGGAVSEGNEGGTVDTNNDTYVEGEI